MPTSRLYREPSWPDLAAIPSGTETNANMRISSIILSLTGLMAVHVLANPAGDAAQMEDIEKRGCNTGSWCCTVANPSSYCAKYCTHGSQYINCYESYVSRSELEPASTSSNGANSFVVPIERSLPMQVPLLKNTVHGGGMLNGIDEMGKSGMGRGEHLRLSTFTYK
jgi:hypothetical protein